MEEKYDSTEARDLLGRVAGAHSNFRPAKHSAGIDCLARLEALVKEVDFNQHAIYTRRPQHNVLEIGIIGGRSIRFAARGDGVAAKLESGETSVLEFSYNVVLDILEGPDEPVAVGQPKRRRSALAVLAEAAANVLGQPYEP